MSKNSICFTLKWSPSRTSFLIFKLLRVFFFQDETAEKRNYIIGSINARLHKITPWPWSLEGQGSQLNLEYHQNSIIWSLPYDHPFPESLIKIN